MMDLKVSKKIINFAESLGRCVLEDQDGEPGDLLSLRDMFTLWDLICIASQLSEFGYAKEVNYAETEQK